MLLFGNIGMAPLWAFICTSILWNGAVSGQVRKGVPILDQVKATQIYALAENWVKRAAVPKGDVPFNVAAANVSAVRVTIRRGGPTIGQATTVRKDPLEAVKNETSPKEKIKYVDVVALTRDAVGKALDQAQRTLRLVRLTERETARFQLDVQFALAPHRLRLNELSDIFKQFHMNLDGLAMNKGKRWAWSFPGNVIASNLRLNGQFNQLLTGTGMELKEIELIGKPRGPALYKFDVLHVVRIKKDDSRLTFLSRGNEVLPARPIVGGAELRRISESLVKYLLGRQQKTGHFTGTYEPTPDRYKSKSARTIYGALAVIALSRYSKAPAIDQADAALKKKAGDAARKGLLMINRPLSRGGGTTTTPMMLDTAFTLMAALETNMDRDSAPMIKALRLRMAKTLETMQTKDGRFQSRTGGKNVDTARQALGAAALAMLYRHNASPQTLEKAQLALGLAWNDAKDHQLMLSMPWLTIAEVTLLESGKANNPDRLANTCQSVWRRQVERADDKIPADVIGGFLKQHALLNEPDSSSMYLMFAQGMVLGRDKIVASEERIDWLRRCGLGVRFIDQLMLDRASAYYCRNTDAAIGGVRRSMWDNVQTLGDSAFALLAVTEVWRGKNKIERDAASP